MELEISEPMSNFTTSHKHMPNSFDFERETLLESDVTNHEVVVGQNIDIFDNVDVALLL